MSTESNLIKPQIKYSRRNRRPRVTPVKPEEKPLAPNKGGNRRRRRRRRKNRNSKMLNVVSIRGENPKTNTYPDSYGAKRQLIMSKKYSVTGGDLRNPINSGSLDSNDFLLGQTGKVTIKYDINTSTLRGYCVSLISYALLNGWRQVTESEGKFGQPLSALRYMYDTMVSVARGTAQDTVRVKVPKFFRDTCAAISPTSTKMFASGTIEYIWEVIGTDVPTGEFDYPFSGAHKMFYGTDTTTENLGFPEMVMSDISGYTTNAGEAAFTSLMNYFNKVRIIDGYNPWEPVDLNFDRSLLKNDTSAFSFVSRVMGEALDGGFSSSLVSSQIHIGCPMFSCFASSIGTPDQGFRQHRQWSGDANSLVFLLTHMKSEREYRNKNYIVWKFIDFYEFAERLATILSVAHQKYWNNDQQGVTTKLTNSGMTATEFLLMLKAHLMRLFSSQFGAQSIYPLPLAAAAQAFQPFLCTTNTCGGYTYDDLNLPLFIVENVRSLLARYCYPDIIPGRLDSDGLPAVNSNSPRWYIPVLGFYTDSVFDAASYTYNNGTLDVPIFTATTIDIDVDTGYETTVGVYLDIAAAKKINLITNACNAYTTELSAFLQLLTPLDGSASPNALESLSITNVIEAKTTSTIDSDDEEIILTKKELKKFSDDKGIFDNSKNFKPSPKLKIDDKALIAITSQQPLLNSLFSVQRAFIIPEIMYYDAGTGNTGSVTPDIVRINNIEPYLVRFGTHDSSDVGLPLFSNRVKEVLSFTVKNFGAEDNENVKILHEASKKGEGGILGGVFSVFKNVAPPVMRIGANILDSF